MVIWQKSQLEKLQGLVGGSSSFEDHIVSDKSDLGTKKLLSPDVSQNTVIFRQKRAKTSKIRCFSVKTQHRIHHP